MNEESVRDNQACCACLEVAYLPVPDGVDRVREHWACVTCGAPFVRQVALAKIQAFTAKCRNPGVNPQKFGKISWREILFEACDIIDRQAEEIAGYTKTNVELLKERDTLAAELKTMNELLTESQKYVDAINFLRSNRSPWARIEIHGGPDNLSERIKQSLKGK